MYDQKIEELQNQIQAYEEKLMEFDEHAKELSENLNLYQQALQEKEEELASTIE